jgi:regulator of RNase E activity RraA
MSVVNKPKSAEMHPGPGFRIAQGGGPRPADATVAGLQEFDTAAVSDLMNRLYTMVTGIRALTDPSLTIAGPACTVKCYPGDNLMVHKSLDIAQPGDVVVVDTSASGMTAVLGDLVCTKARHRGIAGFVVDGLIRDLERIRELADFPVFARGVTPIGPLHRGPGEINHPVAAGGIVVQPGDIVLGDLNGVVIVPRTSADDVLQRLRDRAAVESGYTTAVSKGEFSNQWVDDILAESGIAVAAPLPPE